MKTFEQLNLSEFIQQAIADLNFSTPSAIQAESIPHLLNGEDVIAMAPTGSGKTLAFAIPALEKIDIENKSIQALVLCPTRELAMQVHREFEKLAKFKEEIKILSIYGGQQIGKQFELLKREPQIIIATPGRLMDHLRQKTISLENLKYIVLDEADEMLDMGFRDDINTILEQTNTEHQTVMFSATMEKNILELARKFQKTPFVVDVLDNLQNTPDIEQFYLEIGEKEKAELTARMLTLHKVNSALVFCNTKSNVEALVEILKARSFSADGIHGDMNQGQRERVMHGFKKGTIKILVATDVAGRGIDVHNIEAVFNYDLPRDDEDYIHRIGRTGRAGNSGMAFSFVTKNQTNTLRKIERKNGIKINKKELPTVEELDVARFDGYREEIKSTIENSDLTSFRESIMNIAQDNLSELDIAAALYKLLTKKEQIKINRKLTFEKSVFNYDEQKKSSRPSKRKRNFNHGDGFGKGKRFGQTSDAPSGPHKSSSRRRFAKAGK